MNNTKNSNGVLIYVAVEDKELVILGDTGIKILRNIQKYSMVAITLFALFFSEVSYAQFTIPEKPKNKADQTSLYDYINLLNPSQKKALETKLIKYADSTSTQIVVGIIGTANGDNLDMVGAKWGHEWES